MTKIKDLAVIAVESAFTLFPVSTERYELGRVIFLVAENGLSVPEIRLISGDWRVNQWILERNALFSRAALDFNWSLSYSLRPHLTRLSLDRARRCEATLRFWLTDTEWPRMYGGSSAVIQQLLWTALNQACIVTGDFSLPIVPEGRRLPI